MDAKFFGTELAYKNGYSAGLNATFNFSEENLNEMKEKEMSEKEYIDFLLKERSSFLLK